MLFGAAAPAVDGAVALLTDLGLEQIEVPAQLKALSAANSRYLKDLKLNINTALNAESLGKKDAFLLALSVAVNEKNNVLQSAFETSARANGATDAEIAEVISCTSLMSANNVYYRFRHFMHEEFYDKAQAGIRMSIMANPVLGKELFELVSIVVSAINGCEMCVTSHEKNLVAHGTNKQRIHDAVRLGAVVKSLSVVI
ncbi:carboxymuconolactone decarboxylase family protein [Aridibaculum aurantiacum]|uniref:carboxymuconolactone decarboxylase family protein n=1 Tax=Aridibaculum aurantiacum TaxID=2810307 RepID=UPI001A974821|nr:carboxymuconolactone decarboxylase family protein [Aridibaculum aurantiacum]